MKTCLFCNKELADSLGICPYCGKSLQIQEDYKKKRNYTSLSWLSGMIPEMFYEWGYNGWVGFLIIASFWALIWIIGTKYGMRGINFFVASVWILLIVVIAYSLIRIIICAIRALRGK